MFQHIKDLVELDDSGPKAWKLLRDVIQPNTLPMVIVLEKELAALSIRPGNDVKPVLDKIKDTYARMAAAGSNVSQMQECTKIISVLDNSWDNLIPTLNTQHDQWRPEWLRQQILQEDFRRRHTCGGAANKTAEGYGAAGGSRARGGGREQVRGRGFGRGRGRGDYNEGHGSSGGRGSTQMEGACWYCKKAGHPWFKCFSRPERWAPPGMKTPSGERAQGGAVQGSGAQGDGAHGKADPGMLLMVEDVKGSEGDVGSVGKVVMHPLTHWVIDSGCTSHMTPRADSLDEVKPPGKIKFVAAASGALLPVIGVWNAKSNQLPCKAWEIAAVGFGGEEQLYQGPMAAAHYPLERERQQQRQRQQQQQRQLQEERRLHHHMGLRMQSRTCSSHSSHMRAPSLSSSRYFLTIVDDHTHVVWVYPLKNKGEVAAAVLKEWMPRAQRESGHKVKVIRTDNGGEFIGADFEAVLKKKGIQHKLMVPYNPQQNGMAERFNRTLQEGARTLLGRAGLPDPFWVTALRQVALVKNRVLATMGDKQWVPYTKRYGSEPSSQHDESLRLHDGVSWLVDMGLDQPAADCVKGCERPSRQVQVTVSDKEISGVTEDGGEPEVEEQQQQDAPPCTQRPLDRPRRDVRPLNRLTYPSFGKPKVVRAGSVAEQLKKAIYGLKQAPCAWYHKLEETLLAGGFKKSEYDHSLFLLQEKEQLLMLLVYVDDILLFSESSAMIERAEEMLEMQFKCSKMGDVKYYLGMHVESDLDKGVLRLHHKNYCEGLAEKYGLQDGGKPATPLPSGFTVEPCGDEELEAAKRLVRYVSATASVGLEYSAVRQRQQRGAADLGKGEMLLTCYTDASFNSVKADGTSIGGYVCLFGGGAVRWRSKKQNEVGLSSCETEYMALHHGVKEVVWLRRLLEEIGVCQREPTMMFCDNESAVKLAKNACLHGLTKQIRPKWHWVRRLLDKEVRLEIVKTQQQVSDILTNRLAENEHWKGMKLAGMCVH
ncbi:unnamed protein product [Closterium sp. NIES-53]